MDRCQHNDKIVRFCASECCVWKDSGGCLTCIKKYHSHMGPAVFVEERDIESVLRKYKADSSVKPKVKHLDEYIHNYFNSLRGELMNYLDELDKKVRMELCYPYLSKHGFANVYKKLKKREYRKIGQKEFRLFYDATQKLSVEEYNQEERFLYEQATRKHQKLMNLVFETMGNLQNRLNSIDSSVQCKMDTTLEIKIQNVFDMIASGRATIQSEETLDEEKKSKEQIVVPPPQTIPDNKFLRVPNLDQGKNRSRKKSIEASLLESQLPTTTDSVQEPSDYSKKERELSEMKRKLLTMMASNPPKEEQRAPGNTSRHRANTSMDQYKIVEPKKETETTPSKPVTVKVPTNDTSLLSVKLNTLTIEQPKEKVLNASNKSIGLNETAPKQLTLTKQISEFKHSKLPSQQTEQLLMQAEKKEVQSPRRNIRAIVIPVKADIKIEPTDYSPILKRKQTEIGKVETGFTLKPVVDEPSPQPKLQKKPTPQPEKPKHELSSNQQSSVELLTQSLKRSTDEAIPLLQRALTIAPNNISAAEYLSFLLLEKGQPMECIKVCNSIIEQLEGQALYDINSIHIHTNRAVALIMMGRYSEAIPLLERCLQVKQLDRLYKNLGDAFFLLGIPEKAVYNYEKALSLNNKSAEAHYNLAVCLYSQQNYNNALLYVEKALTLSPANEQYRELRDHTKLKV